MLSSVVKGDLEHRNHAQNEELNSTSPSPTTTNRIYLVTDGLRSKHTKVNYYYAFKQFLKDGAKTQDLQVLLDYKPKILEQMIIGYVEMLRDKRKAHQTIKMHCAAIFHFFRMNDVTLNQRKITRFVPPDESTYSDKAYTEDQIMQIWDAADVRTKVIVLLMASTGMRIGAIPILKVGHLSPISEHNLYQIDVYATSKQDRHITYCTPECRVAIDTYLDYRRRLGEKITDDSPLIREMFDANNPFIINAPKQPTEKMVYDALEQALKNAGVNQRTVALGKGTRRGIMRSHGFRKFWNTRMIKAKVEFNARHALIGHRSVRGLDITYDKTEDPDRLGEYVKTIPLLTIDPKQRLQTRVEELETERDQDITLLKNEIAALKQFVYPGPRPRDKEMRKTYYKALKDYYKEVKGEDVDVPDHLLPDYSSTTD